MLVIHPIDTKFKRTNFVVKFVFLMYVLSFCTALLATVIFKFIYKNLTISLYLPFIDPTNSIIIIKVITWFIIITQTVASVVIMVMHILLIKKYKESSKNVENSDVAYGSHCYIPRVRSLLRKDCCIL